MVTMINEFQGPYRLFSNFEGPEVKYNGIWFPKVEHAYQAGKTLDPVIRRLFAEPSLTAREAKQMGSDIQKRPDWEDVRLTHMCMLVRQKALDRDVLELLLSTGAMDLQEGNRWHDNYWGYCFCPKCVTKTKQNMLGKIYMKLRTELWGFRTIFEERK